MKSGSWASYQSALPVEARAGGEPDDEPLPTTIPASPVPGERFVEVHGRFRFAVMDWERDLCLCIGHRDEHGAPEPDPACTVCRGTGSAGLIPSFVADVDNEQDARLLAFGGRVLREIVSNAVRVGNGYVVPAAAVEAARQVIEG